MKKKIGLVMVTTCYILGALMTLSIAAVACYKGYVGFVEDGFLGFIMSFTFWVFAGVIVGMVLALIISPLYFIGKKILNRATS